MILFFEVCVVRMDLDDLLKPWPHKPGSVQARMVKAADGRSVLQMRVDLGILQMETSDRPDGSTPGGFATYFDFLKRLVKKSAANFVLNSEQCEGADQEFVQYYHRRICWLALGEFDRAVRDADHTLGFMDLVKSHSPSEEYTQAHEQYRGFVLFQRTQAAVALQIQKRKPDVAIEELRSGLTRLATFFADQNRGDEFEEDGMVRHLRNIESTLREQYEVGPTLQEQLEEAIADEDYERAAKLRDAIRKQQ